MFHRINEVICYNKKGHLFNDLVRRSKRNSKQIEMIKKIVLKSERMTGTENNNDAASKNTKLNSIAGSVSFTFQWFH